MVRVTGLEPVRHATHAPQTCLSANSSTTARSEQMDYNPLGVRCQEKIMHKKRDEI